ncbi:hypothetical protein HA138_12990 [Mycobacteroides chelonae]|uniref:phage tail fiber protein n=1 Tax=Mycobacteroides chelonae TaxID=1774 RepID=UPI0018B09E7F|nr:hypothetical protein [Mycobacteroides chelonae]
MAIGISASGLANRILDHLRGGTAWTQPATLRVQLHTGDPGASGTANVSAVTTRSQATYGPAAGGAIALTGTNPSWSMTATEDIKYISVWDAASAGVFLWSAQLAVVKSVQAGDSLTLTSCGLSLGPLAA